ncbi:MAG TPA: LysM peptidoglycan-binding domain-containing protein, partial [Thermodesulfobacteriota bacterium]|nr:LysM peptidoglycan-binding domain-containing protein [Thermodesulfobacteriota bacterium]
MTSKQSVLLLLLLFLPNTVHAVTRYVVKKGDNLYNLSKKFGVPVDTLKRVNGLDGDRLDIGDTLAIPDSKKALTNQKEYLVVKGDTLSQIGARFGVSSEDIKKANNLNSNRLQIGQKLAIPSSKNVSGNIHLKQEKEEIPSKQKEPLQTENSLHSVSTKYTVKKSDTLGAIAYKFGVTVQELKNANGLVDDRLQVGGVLTVPSSGSEESMAQKASVETGQASGSYVVGRGDNLYDLSRKFGVSVSSIKEANGLRHDRLNIGDILLIPGKGEDVEKAAGNERYSQAATTNKIEYFVVRGDTLSGIGSRFGVSVVDIKKINGLKSNNLRIGQRLVIHSSSGLTNVTAVAKDVEVSPPRTEEKKPLEVVSISTPVSIKYTVKKGDTLSELANNFGVSVKDLKSVNGLNSDSLKVGKVLIIPGSVKTDVARKVNIESVITDKRYTVKRGDNLSAIARKFGVSAESIKRANGLKGSSLYAGDVLLIPNSHKQEKATSYQGSYVVMKGDTLGGIGNRFGVSVADLKRANGIKSNTIRVGQVLAVPGQEQYRADREEIYSGISGSNHYAGYRNGSYSSRNSIISVAKKFLGAPYKFGGNSPVKGLDCSAFVNKVFDFFDVDLPRTARDIYKVGESVNKDEL